MSTSTLSKSELCMAQS